MGKFRKKPVVIEARQVIDDRFTGLIDLACWCSGNLDFTSKTPVILIPTPYEPADGPADEALRSAAKTSPE